MPTCPRCRDEYEHGTELCADCRVPLVPDDQPLPPRVDRLLGTFHPVMADRVVRLLQHRRIAHEVLPHPEGERYEVVVDRDFRDDLRSELAVNWTGIVGGLDPEQMYEVLGARTGSQPGWYDAPEGAWIDREGRLNVDALPDEEQAEDAGRLWGPTLAVLGTVLGLFGWYAQRSAGLLVLGLAMLVVGLLSPR